MRPPSVRIQEYELEELYAALRIFERIADSRLTETIEAGTARPSRRCSLGGESYFTHVWNDAGRKIARIHYLRCAFGHLVGVYPSALMLEEVTLFRQGHQRRPADPASPPVAGGD